MRRMIVAATAAAALLAVAAPAYADHTHVLLLGNGKCAVLAANGNEKYVQLPRHSDQPANRQHPLHVNVHLGEAGTRGGQDVIFVQGSEGDLANCTSYVN